MNIKYKPIIHKKDCYVDVLEGISSNHYASQVESFINKIGYNRQVELFTNTFNKDSIVRSGDKFLVLDIVQEPPSFRISNSDIIKNQNLFDLILTWDKEILHECDNAKKMLFGTTWVLDKHKEIVISNKRFDISFVCGSKSITDGHKLRRSVWNEQRQIKSKKSFFISSKNKIPKVENNIFLESDTSSKYNLFFSKYNIAVENTKIDNYFSEKLMDCFVTKTVPIYYGCPNIGDYFNIDGIIVVNNEKEIIDACNSVDNDTYDKMKEAINENYEKSKMYSSFFGRRLFDIIDRISVNW